MPAPLAQPGAERARAHRGSIAHAGSTAGQPATTIPFPGIATRPGRAHPVSMPTLSRHLIVDAPADAVWEVIGHQFGRIGAWATAIPRSAPIPAPTTSAAPTRAAQSATSDAPVAGRVCHTGLRLVPQITERLVAYDDANRTLTYQAEQRPRFLKTARTTGGSRRSTSAAPGSACTPPCSPVVCSDGCRICCCACSWPASPQGFSRTCGTTSSTVVPHCASSGSLTPPKR